MTGSLIQKRIPTKPATPIEHSNVRGKKTIRGYIGLKVSGHAIKLRSYLANSHMTAAIHFAELSSRLENAKSISPRIVANHSAYVTASIFAAVAFLEAVINEVFSDAGEQASSKKASKAEANTLKMMASMWGMEYFHRHATTLGKYQAALTLAGKKQFENGRAPYQDAALLIDLRNALTHFKPVWSETHFESEREVSIDHELKKKLKGKFATNPLTGKYNPFFPDKCLSSECAWWALETSYNLAKEFYASMGPLIKIRPVGVQVS